MASLKQLRRSRSLTTVSGQARLGFKPFDIDSKFNEPFFRVTAIKAVLFCLTLLTTVFILVIGLFFIPLPSPTLVSLGVVSSGLCYFFGVARSGLSHFRGWPVHDFFLLDSGT